MLNPKLPKLVQIRTSEPLEKAVDKLAEGAHPDFRMLSVSPKP